MEIFGTWTGPSSLKRTHPRTTGDVCDADDDNDTVADTADNCQYVANATQADNDGDGIGDACDADDDGDSIIDSEDNCPASANTTQLDTDGDHIGDACDPLTYQFAGFYSPVDNIPAVNTVKAGSSIPLKFALGGNRGLAIFAGGAPASVRIPCGSSDSIDAGRADRHPGVLGPDLRQRHRSLPTHVEDRQAVGWHMSPARRHDRRRRGAARELPAQVAQTTRAQSRGPRQQPGPASRTLIRAVAR